MPAATCLKRYLNIGPGNGWQREGWQTLDYYYTDADHVLDLREAPHIPIASSSLDVIFSSHTIEHISDKACKRMLAECMRLLRPGGTLRLACPDFERAIGNYLASGDPDPKNEVVPRTLRGAEAHLKLLSIFASFKKAGGYKGMNNDKSTGGYTGGPVASEASVKRELARRDVLDFGKWCVSKIPKDADYVAHINAYTFDKLEKMLRDAGFQTIERSGYRGSRIPELREEGFDNRPDLTLFVEARATGWKKRCKTLLEGSEFGEALLAAGRTVHRPLHRTMRKLRRDQVHTDPRREPLPAKRAAAANEVDP